MVTVVIKPLHKNVGFMGTYLQLILIGNIKIDETYH